MLTDIENLVVLEKHCKLDPSKTFGYIYHYDNELVEKICNLSKHVYHSSCLDHKAFPEAKYFESNVINDTLTMLGRSHDSSCATITSGGTESIVAPT